MSKSLTIILKRSMDCFVISLLAMTADSRFLYLHLHHRHSDFPSTKALEKSYVGAIFKSRMQCRYDCIRAMNCAPTAYC